MLKAPPEGKPLIAAKDRVPILQRIAYGAGGVASGIQDRFDNGVINPVFVVGAGLSPVVMSFAGAFYRLYDAFTDVAMGWISDNTRSRWGRRRPWVFLGAILMGLSMPWLFFFNTDWPVLWIGVWMILFNLLILTTQTIFEVPYQALLMESTPDTNERTNVAAWRGFVGIFVGLVVNWSWWLSQRPVFHVEGQPDVLHGIRCLIFIAAVPVIVLGILPALFMKERFYAEAREQKKTHLLNSLKCSFTNKPFILLVCFIFVFVGGTGMHWGLVFYVKLFYVCQGNQELASHISGWEGSIQAVVGLLGVPLAQRLALRLGKMKAILLAIGCFFIASASTWFLMTPDAPYLSMLPFVMLGPVTTMMWVVIPSMLGDVIDYDEYLNHERIEGAYTAAFGWILKVARTLSAIVSGPLVVWAGYEASKRHELVHNIEVLDRMRLLLMVIPSSFLVLSAIALLFYPLSASRVREIRTALEARRGAV